jgi:hypothetical protein
MLIELSDWKKSEDVGSCNVCYDHFNANGLIVHDVVELKVTGRVGGSVIRFCNKALWKFLIDGNAAQLKAVDLLMDKAIIDIPDDSSNL